MAVFRMIRPAQSLKSSHFATYNEALAFSKKAAELDLAPTRPYRKMNYATGKPQWHVTLGMPAVELDTVQYERVAA